MTDPPARTYTLWEAYRAGVERVRDPVLPPGDFLVILGGREDDSGRCVRVQVFRAGWPLADLEEWDGDDGPYVEVAG